MTGFSREFVLARVFVHQTGGNTRVLVVDRGRSVLHHGTQSEMYSSPPYVNETPYRDDISRSGAGVNHVTRSIGVHLCIYGRNKYYPRSFFIPAC